MVKDQLIKKLGKGDPTSLQSFTFADGRKFRLAIIIHNLVFTIGANEPHHEYAYVAEDKSEYCSGTYSGGRTGAGVSKWAIHPIDGEEIVFVEWM